MAAVGTIGNVSPGIGGSIYWAPVGSTIPTDAKTDLDTAFVSLGYVSEDGVAESIDNGVEMLNVWGKRNAKGIASEKEHTVSFTLVEPKNAEVRKLVYADDTATAAAAKLSGITDTLTAHAYVVNMVTDDGKAKRLVIPNGFVTDIGEITYSDTEVIGYEITITATADDDGYSIYDYQET